MSNISKLENMHSAGLLSDDEYTSGLLIMKWANDSRETSVIARDPIETKGYGEGWPAQHKLFWIKGWVGDFAWRVLAEFLIHENSVAEIEEALDLPARSGKVALKTALSCAAVCIYDENAAVPQ